MKIPNLYFPISIYSYRKLINQNPIERSKQTVMPIAYAQKLLAMLHAVSCSLLRRSKLADSR